MTKDEAEKLIATFEDIMRINRENPFVLSRNYFALTMLVIVPYPL
jgi:hypothetical protein